MNKKFIKDINAKIKRYEMFEEFEEEGMTVEFVENGFNDFGDKLFSLMICGNLLVQLAYYNKKEFVLENVGSEYTSTYWFTMQHLIELCNNY